MVEVHPSQTGISSLHFQKVGLLSPPQSEVKPKAKGLLHQTTCGFPEKDYIFLSP